MKDIDTPDRIRRCHQVRDDDGEVWQLRVEWDVDDSASLFEIATEKMTSDGADSQVVKGHGHSIVVYHKDVPWLLRALADAYTHREAAEEAATKKGQSL